MSDSQTLEVATFSGGLASVVLPHPSTVSKARAEVAAKLGVSPEAMRVFQLHLGVIGRPKTVLKDEDHVPQGVPLSLQRWHFDVEEERILTKRDDKAIHLLYCEAKHRLDAGQLQPSVEQTQELDALSDPLFPTERQFLELARSVPGYSAYAAGGCRLQRELQCNEGSLGVGAIVSCVLDVSGVVLEEEEKGGGRVRIHWPWKLVRRWKITPNVFRFEACVHKQNAPILEWVSMETKQAEYLFHTASALCDSRKASSREEQLPNPLNAGRSYDPLREFVNSVLYSAPKFTALDANLK